MMKRFFLTLAFCFLAISQFSTLAAPLRLDEEVPDFQLIDHNSQKVSLKDFRGKGVVISFLFTRCPYPDKCPMIGRKLKDLANLVERTGDKDRLQVLAITLDPAYDKPEVLKAYMQGFDKTQKSWRFLTGTEDQIAQVASAFGVAYWNEKGLVEHNMRTAFIDPQGRLRILKNGSTWRAGEFAAEIKVFMDK